VWEAFYGNAAAARQSAAKALALGRGGREVNYAAAFALTLAGDLPQARALGQDLAREFPEDTSVQFMYLPTLRALFSLNTPTPDAAAAIQALQTASRYDLALGGIGFIGRFGGLYPIYVRGQAYLAAQQPANAAVEFQRILDHRSIVLVDPMDALARLQLARALALSGDAVRAKSAYNDLFALWKNADPGISGSQRRTGGVRQVAVIDIIRSAARCSGTTSPTHASVSSVSHRQAFAHAYPSRHGRMLSGSLIGETLPPRCQAVASWR
jgi:tetratricopeptide (TPR) repeat protein